MLIGIYYLSSEITNGKMNNLCNLNEVLKAYQLGDVSLRSVVGISNKVYLEKTFDKEGIIITTVGKIILNNAFHASFNYVNLVNVSMSKSYLIK